MKTNAKNVENVTLVTPVDQSTQGVLNEIANNSSKRKVHKPADVTTTRADRVADNCRKLLRDGNTLFAPITKDQKKVIKSTLEAYYNTPSGAVNSLRRAWESNADIIRKKNEFAGKHSQKALDIFTKLLKKGNALSIYCAYLQAIDGQHVVRRPLVRRDEIKPEKSYDRRDKCEVITEGKSFKDSGFNVKERKISKKDLITVRTEVGVVVESYLVKKTKYTWKEAFDTIAAYINAGLPKLDKPTE